MCGISIFKNSSIKLLTSFCCWFVLRSGAECGAFTRTSFNFFFSRTASSFHKFFDNVRKSFSRTAVLNRCFSALESSTVSATQPRRLKLSYETFHFVAVAFEWWAEQTLDFFDSFVCGGCTQSISESLSDEAYSKASSRDWVNRIGLAFDGHLPTFY